MTSMHTWSALREPVILIGPMKTGKSVVGKLLAAQLGCSFTSLDRLEHQYAKSVGFDDNVAAALQTEQGDLAWYTYRRSFFDAVIVQFLAEHAHGILELGGGHPILPDDEKQSRVNEALAPYQNVVLLMPSADLQTSIDILKQRQKPERLNPDLNKIFLKDRRFFEMAKFVIYTQGKSPEETCQEIINTLSL